MEARIADDRPCTDEFAKMIRHVRLAVTWRKAAEDVPAVAGPLGRAAEKQRALAGAMLQQRSSADRLTNAAGARTFRAWGGDDAETS